MSNEHRQNETREVLAFLRAGYPRMAFILSLVRRLGWSIAAVTAGIGLVLNPSLPARTATAVIAAIK
ncbi:hypothetical protein P1X14_11170 [Sphingomonas sp. AOB5]|uniref:hypothetical protein n=1 Tax=Sphingomonas sp. AOB5 TaxID=3034017 RepID=UPI0023F71782|nr:hypothetical protein [Sphingomonas sp. AOB5]MDF7775808.1 hypothetical protein [Sphingomonas sp. AOB5]